MTTMDKRYSIERYQNTLRKNVQSIMNSPSDRITPTMARVENVKDIIKEFIIRPMTNYDNMTTVSAIDTNMNKDMIDLRSLFAYLDMDLAYIKSGATGHAFRATSRKDPKQKLVVKIAAYGKEGFGGIQNMARPENAELRMIKLLSYFVVTKKTPHFVLPLYTSYTTVHDFVDLLSGIYIPEKRMKHYDEFIKRYKENKYDEIMSVFIGEWCNGGDLCDFLARNYQNLSLNDWRTIMFQILYTLYVVQEIYPGFKHCDMKPNNILVNITDDPDVHPNTTNLYKIKGTNTMFKVPVSAINIKIWDFDFASIEGIIDNDKTDSCWAEKHCISPKKNRYYDIHYFLNTLSTLGFFPLFYKGGAPKEIVDFVHRVVPKEYRKDKRFVTTSGRLIVQKEFLTPKHILLNDELFAPFRKTI